MGVLNPKNIQLAVMNIIVASFPAVLDCEESRCLSHCIPSLHCNRRKGISTEFYVGGVITTIGLGQMEVGPFWGMFYYYPGFSFRGSTLLADSSPL
jgi:hypothetical protein